MEGFASIRNDVDRHSSDFVANYSFWILLQFNQLTVHFEFHK